jgi:hypothetical protein
MSKIVKRPGPQVRRRFLQANAGRSPTEVFGKKFKTTFADRREQYLENIRNSGANFIHLLETSDMVRVYPVHKDTLWQEFLADGCLVFDNDEEAIANSTDDIICLVEKTNEDGETVFRGATKKLRPWKETKREIEDMGYTVYDWTSHEDPSSIGCSFAFDKTLRMKGFKVMYMGDSPDDAVFEHPIGGGGFGRPVALVELYPVDGGLIVTEDVFRVALTAMSLQPERNENEFTHLRTIIEQYVPVEQPLIVLMDANVFFDKGSSDHPKTLTRDGFLKWATENTVASNGAPFSQTFCGFPSDFPIIAEEYTDKDGIVHPPFSQRRVIFNGDDTKKVIPACTVTDRVFIRGMEVVGNPVILTGTDERPFGFIGEGAYSDHLNLSIEVTFGGEL